MIKFCKDCDKVTTHQILGGNLVCDVCYTNEMDDRRKKQEEKINGKREYCPD